MTPLRVVVYLVAPAATTAVLLAWAAIDSAAFAYRLHRRLRTDLLGG